MIKIKIKEKKSAEGEKPFKLTLYLPLWGNLYGLIASVAYKQYCKDRYKNPKKEGENVEDDLECAENEGAEQESVGCESVLLCDEKDEINDSEQDDGEKIELEVEGVGGKKQKYKLTAEELQIEKATRHMIKACIKQLKRFRRRFGRLVLVDVQSDDCDVIISI